MKLAKGNLKIVSLDLKAIKENTERLRNRGRILVPTVVVYEYDEAVEQVYIHTGYFVQAKGVISKVRYGKFPYPWAPRPLNEMQSWFETADEVNLNQIQPEEVK